MPNSSIRLEINSTSRVRVSALISVSQLTPSTGIAYQLTDNDPLVNTAQCKLDAALMKELGANTIRVYHVDPNGDHDGCMSAFADAGIYLFVDLETFNSSIDQVCSPRLGAVLQSS